MPTLVLGSARDQVIRYLRHFHLRGVPKGNFQLLIINSSFTPEWILGDEDKCEDVPDDRIIISQLDYEPEFFMGEKSTKCSQKYHHRPIVSVETIK